MGKLQPWKVLYDRTQESQSLSPSKITVKKLIGDKFLQNKWNTDVRDTFNNHFTIVIYGRNVGHIKVDFTQTVVL